MSKPIKNLIASEYTNRFKDVSGAVVVEIRGLDSKATTSMRNSLRSKGIRITVVKNALARRTFKGGPLASLEKALKGPSAILTGPESAVLVAREIVKAAEAEKKTPAGIPYTKFKLGVPKESISGEQRVATTPSVVAKYKKLGLQVAVEKGAGVAADISDKQYADAGAEILPKEICYQVRHDFQGATPHDGGDRDVQGWGNNLLDVVPSAEQEPR